MDEHFDAIVIGSGFGGSVLTYRLAQAGKRVCLLERGKAYPPGSYPRAPHELRKNFWDPSEGLHGMFDIWSFRGIESVVTSGLGGGSLTYANVLIRKPERWFLTPLPSGGYQPWPITRADLDPHYDAVEKMMAVQTYPFREAPYSATPKTVEFQAAAKKLGLNVINPPLAVTFRAPGADRALPGQAFDTGGGNLHGASRLTCRLCGECDVGCNDGAKNSLDFTYLSAIDKRFGEIRTRCEVRTIEPRSGGGYRVGYVVHAEEAEGVKTKTRKLPIHYATADKLVVAAGTLGSNYLLLANQKNLPGLSKRLGQRFSGNGDVLSFAYKAKQGRGGPRELAPSRGPVITSTIHSDTDDPRNAFYLQDAGFPQFASWLADSFDAPSGVQRALRFLKARAWSALSSSPKGNIAAQVSGLLPDETGSGSMMPLLGMGMDVPEGKVSVEYVRGKARLTLDWPNRASRPYFKHVGKTAERVAHAMGADFQANPLQQHIGQLVTVHPLGGCAMGTSAEDGVVNTRCEVFGHPGLYIVDGSVMPGPVGPNPSLTIAAIADRAATHMLS